jgi:glycosyltransferase involved in cell wall biosynthesis
VKILFVNLSSLKFDVATPEREPLGGSESSLCYLARQLARNGHDVTLAARLPNGSADPVEGVRHRPVDILRDKAFFDRENFAVTVSVNAAIAAPRLRENSPAAVNILWDHLPPQQEALQPLTNPAVCATIDHIVYVSAWQKAETEQHLHFTLPSRIIANGVTPAFENMFSSPRELLAAKQRRAAYTSVPDRGLAELLEALPGDLPLDVFSSMRVYQSGDEAHADVLQRAARQSGVVCHGSLSQRELAARLKGVAFLTYPCITPETFCLAALEGLAAGMKVIATGAGGIPATTMGFADLVPVTGQNNRAQFVAHYRQALEDNAATFKNAPEAWAERAFAQVEAVNRQCRWTARAKEWEELLGTLAAGKSAVESRRSSG